MPFSTATIPTLESTAIEHFVICAADRAGIEFHFVTSLNNLQANQLVDPQRTYNE
jgi:hypothetical protein